MFDLTGRVALVTGAGKGGGSGTGAGIARVLAEQGATVAVNDFVSERAESTVQEILDRGGRAICAPFDVTDYEGVQTGVIAIAGELGPIDILVNNAGNGGITPLAITPFADSSPADWSSPVAVNFYGVLNCVHVVLGGMIDRKWGRIITISSGAAMIGLRQGVSIYAGAKGAAVSFMRHLAVENGRTGVTANTVAIGFQEPREWSPAHDRIVRATPVGRLGRPEDIGGFIAYLASREAEWVTGQTFQINGGGTTT